MQRKSHRHRKAAHKQRGGQHHRQVSVNPEVDVESHAAENRGYDAYDRIDYGYDLSRGLVGDTPPERTTDVDNWDTLDPYSPS